MIELPDEIFRNRKVVEQISAEQQQVSEVENIIINNGVWVWLKGAAYPQWGMVTPEMLRSMNVAKRLFMEMVRVATSPVLIPLYMYLAVSRNRMKFINKVLRMYADTIYKEMSDYVLLEKHQPDFSKELEWFVFFFAKQIGVEVRISEQLAEVLSTLIQGDNAYRYRVMDFFQGMNKENMIKNPRKEIGKLINMICSREKDPVVRKKFMLVGMMFQGVLLIPSIKKALILSVEKTNINKLKFNEIDLYWALLYKDYNSLGMSYAGRMEYLGDIDKPEIKWQ